MVQNMVYYDRKVAFFSSQIRLFHAKNPYLMTDAAVSFSFSRRLHQIFSHLPLIHRLLNLFAFLFFYFNCKYFPTSL